MTKQSWLDTVLVLCVKEVILMSVYLLSFKRGSLYLLQQTWCSSAYLLHILCVWVCVHLAVSCSVTELWFFFKIFFSWLLGSERRRAEKDLVPVAGELQVRNGSVPLTLGQQASVKENLNYNMGVPLRVHSSVYSQITSVKNSQHTGC